ncbi:MAG: hypothetical protein AAGC46_08825, partial [Solirubrobacteraceae bacterium]
MLAATAPTVLYPNASNLPVLVGAEGGHVVAVSENVAGGSTLLDITGGTQKVIAQIKGSAATPTVGTGPSGEPEVVLQPCLSEAYPDRPVHCKLREYDLDGVGSVALAGTTGATIGAIDHGRYVSAKPSSGVAGTTVTLGPTKIGEERFVDLPLRPVLDAHATGYRSYDEAPRVTSLSLSKGVVAATVQWGVDEHEGGGEGGGSLLLRSVRGATSGSTGGWQFLARSGYGGASGIPRVFRAATMTSTGIRAFYDGGDNDPGYVGRWTAAGMLVKRIATRSFHTPLVDDSA